MAIKGQTHQKRAREFALKERRERKQAKKEARAAGIPAEEAADGTESAPTPEAQPETTAEWVQ